jgi:hypothetical protein
MAVNRAVIFLDSPFTVSQDLAIVINYRLVVTVDFTNNRLIVIANAPIVVIDSPSKCIVI